MSFNTSTRRATCRVHLVIPHELKLRGTEVKGNHSNCPGARSLGETPLKAVNGSRGTKEIMLFEKMVEDLCGSCDDCILYDHRLLYGNAQ